MTRTAALSIRTPEGIVFSLPLAGPTTRLLAWCVDLACVTAISYVVQFLVMILAVVSVDFARALLILLYFVISIGYGIATEWFWRGQTLGKRLLGLRVMDAEGLKLTPSQVVVRNLLRAVDVLPVGYFVGGVSCFFTRNAQRLGDLAANTVVIRTPRIVQPDLAQAAAGKFNSLAGHPHLVARLRQRMSPSEASLALRAVLRREKLMPLARVRLFGEIAAHIRSLVLFPQEATEGLSDEQYVRNAVELLFQSARA